MAGLGEIIGGFSGFKGRLLLFAGVVVLAGMAWGGVREFARSGEAVTPAKQHGEARTDWMQGPSFGEGLLWKSDLWSRAAVRIGLSFIVAMLAGSILRAAFKTGLTLIVLAGIAVWFLEYRGYVRLWDEYYQTVQEGSTWLAARTEVIGQFLKAHLPSTGAAMVGFGFGLRK